MTAIVITRTGKIYPLQHTKKTSLFDWISVQAVQACRQFFDQVDFDHTRNQIKNLPTAIFFCHRTEINTFRKCAQKEFRKKTWWLLLRYELERYLRGARKEIPAFQRVEKFLFMLLMATLAMLITAANTSQGASRPVTLENILSEMTTLPTPRSWLNGEAKLIGSREAVLSAHTYATAAQYPFASDTSDREQMVADGHLIKLEGNYIELVDVAEPYVMPAVAQFVNRLGELHASKGCGKLVVTSALRTLEHQGTLSNGSNYSVHPTGMSIDLRRPVDEESFCASWLRKTLLEIEASGRIDVTAEKAPRHYHVVVLPNEYSSWLARQPRGLDPEVKWLAMALYFEASFNESMAGYRAIGWAVRNRVRSSEFPNTIVEVVAEGAAGRSAGGCQFSFMCDGKAERTETLCIKPDTIMAQFWLNKCDERWGAVVSIAEKILAETRDPTGGAVLYYAASMKQAPYWAKSDMRNGTVRTIGSHVFACSVHRGDDACEA